jgi:ABC-2 type transport system permease protein
MLHYIRNILNLCHKELLTILKDPKSRSVLFVPVLVQTLLFGYAATFELKKATFALYDESQSQLSREFVNHLTSNQTFELVTLIKQPQQMAQIINEQKALFVLKIPTDFEQKIRTGQATPVQLIVDGRNANTAAYATSYISAIVGQFNQTLQQQYQPEQTSNMIQIETRAWYNPNLETRWFIMPALIATLNMIQTLLLTALSVAREREQGTFDQLQVTPLTPFEIMVGKAIPSILVGLIQSTTILLVIMFWFKIPMAGSLLTLYAGLFLFTTASVSIGLMISALVANMQQAMFYTFIMIMPMILLSGLMTPIENMPTVLQQATMLNPLRHAIDFVRRVYLEGATIGQLSYDLWPLFFISLVSLPIASWFFRHKLT